MSQACLKTRFAGRLSREERLFGGFNARSSIQRSICRSLEQPSFPMPLIAAKLDTRLAPRLDDCDPLPPDDRVSAPDSSLDRLYGEHATRLFRFFSRRAGTIEAPARGRAHV